MKNTIREKYCNVLNLVSAAAVKSGRNPEDVRLVVVTKTKPITAIEEVIDAGANDLGENYVEDALPKISSFEHRKEINWHMVGHVQSRKAELVCNNFQYIHSVDSLKIAEKFNRILIGSQKKIPVWLEFNISGESTKSGWNIIKRENWEAILPDIKNILSLTQLDILGLMTMPPYSSNPEESRPYYKKLREFQKYIVECLQLTSFRELSIGMSSDFEVAIEEGSTCVRIGQAIMGERNV